MKECYERPLYIMEEFVANQVIASGCDATRLETQCLTGGATRYYNVVNTEIFSTCTGIDDVQAGYVENVIGAVKINSSSGTNGTQNGSLRSSSGESYSGRVYYTPTNADGLLYFCLPTSGSGSATRDQWNVDENVLYHYANSEGNNSHRDYHCEVIGVTSEVTSV